MHPLSTDQLHEPKYYDKVYFVPFSQVLVFSDVIAIQIGQLRATGRPRHRLLQHLLRPIQAQPHLLPVLQRRARQIKPWRSESPVRYEKILR